MFLVFCLGAPASICKKKTLGTAYIQEASVTTKDHGSDCGFHRSWRWCWLTWNGLKWVEQCWMALSGVRSKFGIDSVFADQWLIATIALACHPKSGRSAKPPLCINGFCTQSRNIPNKKSACACYSEIYSRSTNILGIRDVTFGYNSTCCLFRQLGHTAQALMDQKGIKAPSSGRLLKTTSARVEH